ncbi:hypothetical protein TI39_contig4112g00020 [Zymoseptoria brevis]|uniref:1,3-beta-glucanosyltransferase n=1 Tax=Zymoseptoria brevis TaxID=1047168 RepID=A0A0F4GGY0_9PEZI|nr:hypothetical protein TI39_contig4112g00020 [Zymoseptoria brevis]
MTAALETVTLKERYFWRGDKRFLVRGVVYQLGHEEWQNDRFDALSDERLSRLQADISLFEKLGINTIFAYSIDVSKSHDRAMKLLEEAGIYVLVVRRSLPCIRRNDPPASYTASLLQHYFKTLDVMSRYKNTLGVLAANVLVNNHASEACIPVIAAVIRDMKQYMRLKADATGQRILPVGYAAAASDDRNLRMLDFLCSQDQKFSIDFWTFTCYERFGDADQQPSRAHVLAKQYLDAKIPVFISEYGSQPPRPRQFDETRVLFSRAMTEALSGGCVYEFFAGVNGYGLVWYASDESKATSNLTDKMGSSREVVDKRRTHDGTLSILEDFVNYQKALGEMKNVKPATETEGAGPSSRPKSSRLIADGSMIPASCVDWAQLAQELEAEVADS